MITAQDDPFVPYESFLAALVRTIRRSNLWRRSAAGIARLFPSTGQGEILGGGSGVDFCDGLRA